MLILSCKCLKIFTKGNNVDHFSVFFLIARLMDQIGVVKHGIPSSMVHNPVCVQNILQLQKESDSPLLSTFFLWQYVSKGDY